LFVLLCRECIAKEISAANQGKKNEERPKEQPIFWIRKDKTLTKTADELVDK